MFKHIFFAIVLLKIVKATTEDKGPLIAANIKMTSEGFMVMPLTVGKEKQNFTLVIDSHSHHTFLRSLNIKLKTKDPEQTFYYYNSSDSHKNESVPLSIFYENGNVSGITIKGDFEFQSHSFEQYFIIAKDYQLQFPEKYHGALGLGRPMLTWRSYPSFISNLAELGIVQKRVYSLKLNMTDLKESTLFIGDYHADFLKEGGSLGYCNATSGAFWDCNVTKVLIGSPSKKALADPFKALELNTTLLFETWSRLIVAPIKVMKWIRGTLLPNCEVVSYELTYTFQCIGDIDAVQNFSLVLDHFVVTIPKDVLFVKSRDNVYSMQMIFLVRETKFKICSYLYKGVSLRV